MSSVLFCCLKVGVGFVDGLGRISARQAERGGTEKHLACQANWATVVTIIHIYKYPTCVLFGMSYEILLNEKVFLFLFPPTEVSTVSPSPKASKDAFSSSPFPTTTQQATPRRTPHSPTETPFNTDAPGAFLLEEGSQRGPARGTTTLGTNTSSLFHSMEGQERQVRELFSLENILFSQKDRSYFALTLMKLLALQPPNVCPLGSSVAGHGFRGDFGN